MDVNWEMDVFNRGTLRQSLRDEVKEKSIESIIRRGSRQRAIDTPKEA